jgi:hypothetical protein
MSRHGYSDDIDHRHPACCCCYPGSERVGGGVDGGAGKSKTLTVNRCYDNNSNP